MTNLHLKTSIDAVLDGMDQNCLRWILDNQDDTIYRLSTLKNKMRKKPSVVGVCGEIRNIVLVKALSPTWKHFSGNNTYPVPGNDKNRDPELAYSKDHSLRKKWIGQQKRYRFSLIDHLLKNAPAFYKAVEKRLK